MNAWDRFLLALLLVAGISALGMIWCAVWDRVSKLSRLRTLINQDATGYIRTDALRSALGDDLV